MEGVIQAYELCDFRSCQIHGAPRVEHGFMKRASGISVMRNRKAYGFRNAFRFHEGGGTVVKINHGRPSILLSHPHYTDSIEGNAGPHIGLLG